MTVRQIRIFGDPVLKTASESVNAGDDIRGLVEDLIDTVKLPGRAGVAAPQIGVSQRVFSYNVDGEIGYIINPVLVSVAGEPQRVDEGCLSVPGLYFQRMRYPEATVTGTDLAGDPIEICGSGVMAQALQHETDHLEGRLYIDGLDKETKREAMRQIRESDWF